MSLYSLLRESVQVLCANFSLICLLVLTFSIPDSFFSSYLWYELWAEDFEKSDSIMPIFGPLSLFFFNSVVFYPLQSASVVYAIAQRYRGEPVSYTEAILVGLRRWPYLMPAYFMTMTLFCLGFMLFIIPGFFVLIYFALIDQNIVLGQCGPIQGLRKSANLIKGHAWFVLGIFGIIFVPSIGISFEIGNLMGQIPTLDNVWFDTVSDIPLDIFFSLSFITMTIFYFKKTNKTTDY